MRFALVWSEAASGLRRNLSMVISVILVTFISLTLVGAAILMQMQIGQMKNYWYDRAQVAVYMCTATDSCPGGEATADQVAQIKAKLESPTLKPFIKKFYFQNHQQAYEQFKQQFKGNDVVQTVTPALLNETYWVNLKNPSQSDVIEETLTAAPGVQSVVDQRSYLDPIFSMLNTGTYTAVGIAVLMLISAALLIATTIRLSAFSRRRELGIMRLVGASNRFIQTPFILEGVFAALIGSVMAGAAIVVLIKVFVQGYLAQQIQTVNFVGLNEAWIVVPVLLVVGILLAAFSANFAITRYLKV